MDALLLTIDFALATLMWLLFAIDLALETYMWLVLAFVVMSLLIAFNVVSPGNRGVAIIGKRLDKITALPLRPIRYLLPAVGGIDVTPVILLLIILGLRYAIAMDLVPEAVLPRTALPAAAFNGSPQG